MKENLNEILKSLKEKNTDRIATISTRIVITISIILVTFILLVISAIKYIMPTILKTLSFILVLYFCIKIGLIPENIFNIFIK